MNLMELVSYITVDKSGFDKGISQATADAKGFAEKIDKVAGKVKTALTAAFSIAAVKKLGDAILQLANDTAEYGDRIDKQSQVLGMSRKAYQEWDYILGQNGVSIDSMSTAMKTLNSNILSAADGTEESANAFEQLGLFINDIIDLNPEDQFEAVVRALQKMPAGAQKSALAVKIFGKAGLDLLPLLNSDSASIDELKKRAQELGIIMSDDAVDASVAYGDALDDLKRAFTGIKNAVGVTLLPALTRAVNRIATFAGKLSNAFQEEGLLGVFNVLTESAQGFINTLKESDNPVLQILGGSLQAVLDLITGIVDLFTNFDGTVAALQASDNPVLQTLGGALSGIKSVFDGIVGLFTDFDGTVAKLQTSDSPVLELLAASLTTIKEVFEGIAGLFNNFDGTVAKLQASDNPVLSTMGDALATIKSVFGEIVNFFTNFGTTVSSLQQSDNPVLVAVGDSLEAIGGFISTIVAFFTGGFSDAVAKLKESDNPVLQVVAGAFETLAGLIDGVVAFFNGGFAEARATLEGSDNAVLTAVSGALGVIQTAGDFIKTLFTEGLPAAIGVLDGADIPILSDIIQAFKDIQTWAQNALDAITSFIQGTPTQGTFEVNGVTYADPMGAFKHAKGLWNVPYDEYPALLHRGERVLTASQARKADGGSFDFSGLSAEITSAIRAGMEGATVRSYINGRDVTREVSRDINRQVKARRFEG